jgi:L-iditol 2-dehydrogenase
MKAARFFGVNDMRVVDVPVPEVGPRDVLVKVVRAGVCATDDAIYTGAFTGGGAVRFPLTPGHEWSGIVEEIGPEVSRFRPGDRVLGDTGVSCGQCYQCLIGQYGNCARGQAVGTVNAWDGAWADYILMPERHTFLMPENLSFDHGAMVEPAATALYAVRRAEVSIGDTVLVHGTGPIGILAAALAKLDGASKVLITGRKDHKLDLALAFGADVAINTTREDLAQAVRTHVGPEGVDRVVEASGAVELFEQSVPLVRGDGVLSLVAFFEKPMDRFDLDSIVLRNLTVCGVAGSLHMYGPVLALMSAGRLDPTPLITARYPFARVAQALDDHRTDARRIKLMLEM